MASNRHRYTYSGKKYNTRIAPSPTGHAHIGTFRTAYFSWLAAKASGGTFLLRIDDTDVNRNQEEAVAPIKDAVSWLGMTPDFEFRQSNNIDEYKEMAFDLLSKGYARELSNGAVALNWHQDMPREFLDNIAGPIQITDTNIAQIDGSVNPHTGKESHLILLKGKEDDYAPTYQFASTFDDWGCGINYIIRGTDHISNTPKQIAIWYALSRAWPNDGVFDYPEFAHVGLIFKDGKKLSKRDGASSVLQYRELGYSPDALLSFILRLGWAPSVDNKENDRIDVDRAIKMFLTEGSMRNVNASMDVRKLDYFQREYDKLNRKAA